MSPSEAAPTPAEQTTIVDDHSAQRDSADETIDDNGDLLPSENDIVKVPSNTFLYTVSSSAFIVPKQKQAYFRSILGPGDSAKSLFTVDADSFLCLV